MPHPGAGRCPASGLHPDDTTPIPRPSRYYGRRQDLVTRDRAQGRRDLEAAAIRRHLDCPRLSPSLVAARPNTRIDKSVLALAEPRRLRDKAHLRFVAAQPCLVCGRQPQRSASPALCPTQSPGPQGQRRVHRTPLPRASSPAAPGRR